MEKVTILYSCDAWHTYDSMKIIGIFSNKEKAIAFAKKDAAKSIEGKLDRGDVYNLTHINQTQNRAQNYHMEAWELNPKNE